jgi:hypothetical protein
MEYVSRLGNAIHKEAERRLEKPMEEIVGADVGAGSKPRM